MGQVKDKGQGHAAILPQLSHNGIFRIPMLLLRVELVVAIPTTTVVKARAKEVLVVVAVGVERWEGG